MTSTNDFFSTQGSEFAPQPDRLEVVAGKVVAVAHKPSAAQKRFNTLMERLDFEQALAAELRHAQEVHVPRHRHTLHQMQAQQQRLLKGMLLMLDERIQAPQKTKGLTANQKQQATRMVLSFCAALAAQQDPEVQAVWTRYAPEEQGGSDWAEQAKQEAKEMLASYLGEDFANGREFESVEDMMRAAFEFEQQKRQAQQEKRDAKRSARKAEKGLTAREQAAAQKELDAQSALRTVFRQLASALHPDREPDENLRKRKTELMSEVNAAYERKDLSTLLRIQIQEQTLDASKATQLSDEKLKAMCNVLAAQVKTLEADNEQVRLWMSHEFGYSPHLRFNVPDLLWVMQQNVQQRQNDLTEMQTDLQRVQDDKELKTWLKEQTRASKY
jgi:hypothetical protein